MSFPGLVIIVTIIEQQSLLHTPRAYVQLQLSLLTVIAQDNCEPIFFQKSEIEKSQSVVCEDL